MATSRLGALSVPKPYAPGLLRVPDVIDSHPRAGLVGIRRLVGHQHSITHDGQGVGPQVRIFQVGLGDKLGVGDVGYIHAGDIFGRAYVGHVKDAAAIWCLMQRYALSQVAVPVQVMMRNEPHVFDFLRLCGHCASSRI